MPDGPPTWSSQGSWQQRLEQIVAMMREMSVQTDPQAMVNAYAERVRALQRNDGMIAVSRRDLKAPAYKITRATAWTVNIDPWKNPGKFPIYTQGILGQLLYADTPQIIQDFQVPPGDPAEDLLANARSIAVIPQYDNGVALNMIVVLKNQPHGFDPERFPEIFWQSNLFGRATASLVLTRKVKEAYDAIDRELHVVADIQRSLLPTQLPTNVGLDIATHYQTSKQAGGDYFDFFHLPDGKLAILIADVSGHGTPAAVLMAILHAIAHVNQAWTQSVDTKTPPPSISPRQWMIYVNNQLCERYTRFSGTFITAVYAVYDPRSRLLTYSSAGHNPPRLRLANPACVLSPINAEDNTPPTKLHPQDPGHGLLIPLDQAQGLPLGIVADADYVQTSITLAEGDVLTLYTDGITEAFDTDRHLFGYHRLDQALAPERATAKEHLQALLDAVNAHDLGNIDDDRTLIVARADSTR